MSKGNCIVVSANPRGVFEEGILDPAFNNILPGTLMEKTPGQAGTTNGRFTWRPSSLPNGYPRDIAILREDDMQGFPMTTAYSKSNNTAPHIFLYHPAPGEDLNVLIDLPGTGGGNVFPIGQLYEADSSGHATPVSGSPASVPFQGNEIVADSSSAPGPLNLAWVTYTGH